MRLRFCLGLCLLLSLSAAGSGWSGTQHFYYDTTGRLLGETQTVGEVRTSKSDTAGNMTLLHVQPLGGTSSVSTLGSGQALIADQNLTSTDGRFGLSIQDDGNLVIYQNSNGAALWSSATNGHQMGYLQMQTDGDLVLYGPDDSPFWASQTDGNPGAYLAMQTDGNLVIYSSANAPLWSTGTGGH